MWTAVTWYKPNAPMDIHNLEDLLFVANKIMFYGVAFHQVTISASLYQSQWNHTSLHPWRVWPVMLSGIVCAHHKSKDIFFFLTWVPTPVLQNPENSSKKSCDKQNVLFISPHLWAFWRSHFQSFLHSHEDWKLHYTLKVIIGSVFMAVKSCDVDRSKLARLCLHALQSHLTNAV